MEEKLGKVLIVDDDAHINELIDIASSNFKINITTKNPIRI